MDGYQLSHLSSLTCPYDAFISCVTLQPYSPFTFLSPVLLDLTYLKLNPKFFLSLSPVLLLSNIRPYLISSPYSL